MCTTSLPTHHEAKRNRLVKNQTNQNVTIKRIWSHLWNLRRLDFQTYWVLCQLGRRLQPKLPTNCLFLSQSLSPHTHSQRPASQQENTFMWCIYHDFGHIINILGLRIRKYYRVWSKLKGSTKRFLTVYRDIHHYTSLGKWSYLIGWMWRSNNSQ